MQDEHTFAIPEGVEAAGQLLPASGPSGPEKCPEPTALAGRVRPLTLAVEQLLPVSGPLGQWLPGGGIRWGSTVVVEGRGSTWAVVQLAAAATRLGRWVTFVDDGTLGVPALAEAGAVLERVVVVRDAPRERMATVVAALLDGVSMVALGPGCRLRGSDARRLAARARERGVVLVSSGPWSERAALRLSIGSSAWRWRGGCLAGRELIMEVGERGRTSRHRVA